jgi:hypothetical protein
MLQFKTLLAGAFLSFTLISCGSNQGEDTGASTPIDSTTMHGTAPVTYGGENPANYQDTVLANSNDTGTKVSTGPDNTQPNR